MDHLHIILSNPKKESPKIPYFAKPRHTATGPCNIQELQISKNQQA
jgi:hypothetical protein